MDTKPLSQNIKINVDELVKSFKVSNEEAF